MSAGNPSVLITGGCGDIGRALAGEFAAAGYGRVALCDLLDPAAAERRLKEVRRGRSEFLYRQADVTDAGAVVAFVEEAADWAGGIDVCIANAGVVERGALVDLAADAWRRTLDVNLTGCYLTAQAAARTMVRGERAGHIVLLSSWTQDVPREGIGAYCVSKSGLKMLAKCLAVELGAHGIRVNTVAPGFVDAGLTGQNLQRHPDRRAGIAASIPLGGLISAADLARAVRAFCGPENAYVTGTTLLVDGGSSLFPRRGS